MKVFNTSFTLNSEEGTEVTDITKLVREAIQQSPISAGIALINTLHTTCAVFIGTTIGCGNRIPRAQYRELSASNSRVAQTRYTKNRRCL